MYLSTTQSLYVHCNYYMDRVTLKPTSRTGLHLYIMSTLPAYTCMAEDEWLSARTLSGLDNYMHLSSQANHVVQPHVPWYFWKLSSCSAEIWAAERFQQCSIVWRDISSRHGVILVSCTGETDQRLNQDVVTESEHAESEEISQLLTY